ncbi:MAG: tRNA (N6-isopentenyl adenosine(37)-C2)-methylthiotransferase MiaB [Ruminococcaceae bacterium]|nr:tRNA (N6-isopentenyl adenosine(37)-C2)-methylthiotransferase MiaB [Oscillospiraceae bacterium]
MAEQHILTPISLSERLEYVARVKEWNEQYTAEQGKRRGCFVLTFGCQQNEADSEKIAGMAEQMGYEIKATPEEADLIMVNTCAIREHAEKKALSIIGQYKHIRARNPNLIIGVCGCMTARDHRRNELKMKYPYVTFTLGTASLHHFPKVLWEVIRQKRRLITAESEEDFTKTVAEGAPVRRESGYRAWVSVMYGCNNFCSYCIVPYCRGRERSRRREDIVREVRELVEAGYKEITLLGQNVNSYGKGTDCDFADLVAELDTIEGDWLLSFMTSHPKDASRKLIDVMAEGKHIARRFHLPMQSGNDRVLKAMNRHYDMAKYLDTVAYMRERMPDIVITSDIIVGFPGETEEEFGDTLKALEAVRFDMLYSFIYSPRKGTPAAEMEQVPDVTKGNRFDRLLATQNAIAAEKNLPMQGTTVRVLCDGESKGNPDVYSGRTEGGKIVFFGGTPDMVGQFVSVRIDRTEAFALWGKVE